MTICEKETGGNILCIRLSALGDVVHCMNALSLLRQERPCAHITWITEDRVAGLIENHPYIDELITVPRVDWGQAIKDPWRWTEVWPEVTELFSGLHKAKYDISMDFQSSMKSSWLVAAARAPVRIGFAPPVSREFNHAFQNRLVSVPEGQCHRIERYLALLAPAGIPTRYAFARLPCMNEHRNVAAGICRGMPRPLAVIHPGTSVFAEFKRWQPERYGELALGLINDLGASVLVTFGPGEEALAHRVVVASRHKAVLVPRLAHLQQLTGLLETADVFIGSDTGPMHMASALGTPVVALFGPKDPAGTAPFDAASEVIRADIACSPCTRRECSDPLCMDMIEQGDVLAAVKRVLKGQAKSSMHAYTPFSDRPFYCDFNLGNWHGKVHTSFSSPAFYRFLSMMGAKNDPGPFLFHQREQRSGGRKSGSSKAVDFSPAREREPVSVRVRCSYKGSGRSLFSFRQYWRMAVKMYNLRKGGIMPVCWMQNRHFPVSAELLVLDGAAGAPRCLVEKDISDAAPDVLRRLAAEMQQLHRKGFHVLSMRAEDFSHPAGGDIAVGSLEKVRFFSLPAVAREIFWGMQLRALYVNLKKQISAEEFTKFFLVPYFSGHIDRDVCKRLLARAIHPELDAPVLLYSVSSEN